MTAAWPLHLVDNLVESHNKPGDEGSAIGPVVWLNWPWLPIRLKIPLVGNLVSPPDIRAQSPLQIVRLGIGPLPDGRYGLKDLLVPEETVRFLDFFRSLEGQDTKGL
jgi:hypothetical protein